MGGIKWSARSERTPVFVVRYVFYAVESLDSVRPSGPRAKPASNASRFSYACSGCHGRFRTNRPIICTDCERCQGTTGEPKVTEPLGSEGALSRLRFSSMMVTRGMEEEKEITKILYALEAHNTVVIQGDLRASAASRAPPALAAAGWTGNRRSVAVTFPKKVTAISTAVRVANANGLDESHLGGDYVGFAVQSQNKQSSSTQIVYYTNESLLHRVLSDPLLNGVSVVMICAFQERSTNVDLLLALSKRIQKVRRALRILVTTADYDGSRICSFFGNSTSKVVNLKSGLSPTTIHHLQEPAAHYLSSAMDVVKDCFTQWNQNLRPVGVKLLVFVKGAEEAEKLCGMINKWYAADFQPVREIKRGGSLDRSRLFGRKAALLEAVPLHATVDLSTQLEALRLDVDSGCIKVVVSTNVAELSACVDGVSVVIDCGLERTKTYNPRTGAATISTVPISHSSANLRASRASISGAGVCYRLYTKKFMDTQMPQQRAPQILREELIELLGFMRAIGIEDFPSLDFLDRPREECVVDAFERLYHLGALTRHGMLTTHPELYSSTSLLSARLAKSLVVAKSYGVERDVAALAAMLNVKQILFNNRKLGGKYSDLFTVAEGDTLTLLNVWRRYVDSGCSEAWCRAHSVNAVAMEKATRHFEQIERLQMPPQTKASKFNVARNALGLSVAECICRSIVAGFFENVARAEPDGTYLVALSGIRAAIAPQSVLRHRMPQWIVYVSATQRSEVCELNDVTVIQPEWVVAYAPHIFQPAGSRSYP